MRTVRSKVPSGVHARIAESGFEHPPRTSSFFCACCGSTYQQVTLRLISVIPAALLIFAGVKVSRSFAHAASSRRLEPTALVHRSMRASLREVERLLTSSRQGGGSHGRGCYETVLFLFWRDVCVCTVPACCFVSSCATHMVALLRFGLPV